MPKTNKKQTKKRNKEQDKMQAVSQEIQVILLKNNMALKPMMTFSPEGIIPQVRLVDTTEKSVDNNKQEDAIDTTDKGEAEGDEDQDGTVEPKQS